LEHGRDRDVHQQGVKPVMPRDFATTQPNEEQTGRQFMESQVFSNRLARTESNMTVLQSMSVLAGLGHSFQ
jgi:hypothetical protein